MDYAELSDLEEGEILEYESGSPIDTRCDDFETKGCSFHSLKKECKGCNFQFKEHPQCDMTASEQGKNGYINNNLRNNWKVKDMKSNISMIDLESISSEEEHKSDEENKYSGGNKKYFMYSETGSRRRNQSTQFYGTVEDIMSEIGETICRKSRCNYKKRKLNEAQHGFSKYSDKSYDLWSHRIFSSHLKNKKHKRSKSFSYSDSDSSKDRVEKRRKKKKKKEISYEGGKKSKKNSQVRDFDEMRQALLEKLKKQKAEEESKASNNECVPEIENSDIQEVDMLIDCTNYVDNPRDEVPEDSPEEELDLIKLRLIALASNKKQRCGETGSKSVTTEELSDVKKPIDKNNEGVDLDKNELLLRAEALKTALLKKHQKRLNRSKVKKVESTEEKGLSGIKQSTNCEQSDDVNADFDAFKENIKEKSESKEPILDSVKEFKEVPSEPSGSLKETLSKPKTKRKKRKSVSFSNNVKENSDKSEPLEEDDRTLRSQLLKDLLKKKSLKKAGEKSVLLESVQASANKPSPSVISRLPQKQNGKIVPVVRKTVLKKVNPPKVKPVMATVIPKAEIQRIIVHLGSEDSSEEDENPCQVPSGLEREQNQEGESERKKGAIVTSNDVNKTIHADYEKSVELLLSQARKKIEGEKRIAEKNTLATPEAVYKHLPPSQRLEYIRLKQKIAEREKLRMEKTNQLAAADSKPQNASTNLISQGPEDISKPAIKPVATNRVVYKSLSKSVAVLQSPSNNRITGGLTNGLRTKETSQRKVILHKTKNNSDVNPGKQLSPGKELAIQRNKLLLPSSQALISKLKLLLKKIKIEKIVEENYEKEIVKLKNQINLLEKKKNEQRFKIKKLGEESMKTYKAIQGITAKLSDKKPAKEDNGSQKKKDEESESKKPEEETEGKKVSNEPEVELSKAQKTDERLNDGDKTSETTGETTVGVCLLDYQSPLQVFNKVSVCSERVDPNVMMCQFDLTGVCKDEECTYQHLRNS